VKTTKEKIEIMEWFENGGVIEEYCRVAYKPTSWVRCEEEPSWDWRAFDYRIVEVKRWEPKYDIVAYAKRDTCGDMPTRVSINTYCKDENAGLALGKLLERTTRIYILAMELGGLKKWSKDTQNWHVYFDEYGKADCTWSGRVFHPTTVYMTEKCAEKICSMINSGEVWL